MAAITRDDVLKLARLARISVSDQEVTQFTAEFNAILAYVEQLQSVDVTGLKPTSQVTGLTNVTRQDVGRGYGYPSHDLLKGVPHAMDDQIQVKRMIG